MRKTKAEYDKTYRDKHREVLNANKRKVRADNPDKIRAQQKAYREKHRSKILSQEQQGRWRNKDKIRSRDKEWYRQNRVEVRARFRKWVDQNRAKLNATANIKRKQNLELFRARGRDWYKNHKDSSRRWSKAYRTVITRGLTDVYIRSRLGGGDVPQDLIDAKRQQLKLHRVLTFVKKVFTK